MRLAAGNVRNCAKHAAAMELVPELEANLSPPEQREGTLIRSRNINVSRSSNHQHRKASTHFAGREVSPSVIVTDRRSEERIKLRPLSAFRKEPRTTPVSNPFLFSASSMPFTVPLVLAVNAPF